MRKSAARFVSRPDLSTTYEIRVAPLSLPPGCGDVVGSILCFLPLPDGQESFHAHRICLGGGKGTLVRKEQTDRGIVIDFGGSSLPSLARHAWQELEPPVAPFYSHLTGRSQKSSSGQVIPGRRPSGLSQRKDLGVEHTPEMGEIKTQRLGVGGNLFEDFFFGGGDILLQHNAFVRKSATPYSFFFGFFMVPLLSSANIEAIGAANSSITA